MIHGMALVRNEGSRKLETEHNIFSRFIIRMLHLTDRFVVLDDNSDDDVTLMYLETNAHQIEDEKIIELYKSDKRMWDKNEVTQRQLLWENTISKAKHGDWIVCLDADELFDHPRELKYMLESLPQHIDGLGFRLFDMWDMEHYREDNLWKAHFYPWTFAVRYDEQKEYVWHDKALHCGRFPANASERMLPTMIPVRHYGWALEEDRKKKYDRYMRIDGDGKHGILAQYESILDENPNLVKFGGA